MALADVIGLTHIRNSSIHEVASYLQQHNSSAPIIRLTNPHGENIIKEGYAREILRQLSLRAQNEIAKDYDV